MYNKRYYSLTFVLTIVSIDVSKSGINSECTHSIAKSTERVLEGDVKAFPLMTTNRVVRWAIISPITFGGRQWRAEALRDETEMAITEGLAQLLYYATIALQHR